MKFNTSFCLFLLLNISSILFHYIPLGLAVLKIEVFDAENALVLKELLVVIAVPIKVSVICLYSLVVDVDLVIVVEVLRVGVIVVISVSILNI